MATDNLVIITGNITQDPDLKVTEDNVILVSFGIAHTTRGPDGKGGFEDKHTSFFNCTVWRDLGEHSAETLKKGMRVTVVGELRQRTWKDKDTGDNRSAVDITVTDVGPSLRWATAEVTKSAKKGNGNGNDRAPDEVVAADAPTANKGF